MKAQADTEGAATPVWLSPERWAQSSWQKWGHTRGLAGDCQDTKRRRQSSTVQQGLLGISGIKELAGENCLERPEDMNQQQAAKVTGPICPHQSQNCPVRPQDPES